MQSVTTETCDLCISVLHAGASQLCVSHIVIFDLIQGMTAWLGRLSLVCKILCELNLYSIDYYKVTAIYMRHWLFYAHATVAMCENLISGAHTY
jgi:hypothetical protein